MRTPLITTGFAALLLLAGCDKANDGAKNTTAPRSDTTTRDTSTPPKADNTAKNERDRDTTNPTPIDQKNNQADIDITAKIRSAVVDDDTMSTNARNCKIITQDGVVTLRGVVDSQAEKDAIEAKAKTVAGVVRVDNQLEVKTPG
jgi:hyperosmotically inducible protein